MYWADIISHALSASIVVIIDTDKYCFGTYNEMKPMPADNVCFLKIYEAQKLVTTKKNI